MPIGNIVTIFENRKLNKLFFNDEVNLGTSDVLLGFTVGFPNIRKDNIPANEMFAILIHFNYVHFRFEGFLINHNCIPQDFKINIKETCDLFTGNFNILMISLMVNDLLWGEPKTKDTQTLIKYLIDNYYLVDVGESRENIGQEKDYIDRRDISLPSNLQIVIPNALSSPFKLNDTVSKGEGNEEASDLLLKYAPKVLESRFDGYYIDNCNNLHLEGLGIYLLMINCIHTSLSHYFMSIVKPGPIEIPELSKIIEGNIDKINTNIKKLIFGN